MSPVISKEDQEAIDKTFPNDLEEVFVVHAGTFQNGSGEGGIARPVCTRIRKEDAESIAEMLNEANEGVMYLKWAASMCFPAIDGGRDELLEATMTEDVRDSWEEIAGPNRKPLYTVAHLKFAKDDEKKTFNDELRAANQ